MEKDFNSFFEEESTSGNNSYREPSEGFVPTGDEDGYVIDENGYADEAGYSDDIGDADEAGYGDESSYAGSYPDEGDTDGESAYTDSEPVPEEEERPKKKKPSFRKRVRRFFRKLGKLPGKTLVIFGGIVAILLVLIILVTVLLSKGCSAKKAEEPVSEAESTTIPEATPTLPPLENPEEGSDTETADPGVHPLEGLGTQGTNGWYLKQGDEYPVIAEIQERLHELGYMDTPVVDGKETYTTKYGSSTKTAVRAFQAVNNIDTDGMLGQSTYDLLMSDAAKPLQFSSKSYDKIFSTYTQKLQTRLSDLHYYNGEISGNFDSKTKQALIQFQAKNGLTADGIAGSMTLEVLYSAKALDATSSVTATAVPTVSAKPAAEATEEPEDVTEEPAA